VVVDGVEVSSLDGRRRAAFRQASCGVVFQDAELLDELSVVENVALPLIFAGVDRKRALVRAQEALAEVGCDHLVDRRPTRISGGEAQRTALARAFVDNPPLIVADEPTAALDAENTMVVGELLRRQAREHDAAVVVATHDPALAALCDDVVALREAAVGAGR
jgi:ABC-type lipoprotein export system ATPase subunit